MATVRISRKEAIQKLVDHWYEQLSEEPADNTETLVDIFLHGYKVRPWTKMNRKELTAEVNDAFCYDDQDDNYAITGDFRKKA